MNTRRRLLASLIAFGAGMLSAGKLRAEQAETGNESLRFPGDPTDHNVIYQFNKADQDYHNAVLYSVGETLRTYNDNVTIVVSVFGPGIHILD